MKDSFAFSIKRHRVFLIRAFSLADVQIPYAENTLELLRSRDWIPHRCYSQFCKHERESIWSPCVFDPSADFLPHIRRLLGAYRLPTEPDAGTERFKLTPEALALVNGMTRLRDSFADTIELSISGLGVQGSNVQRRLDRLDIDALRFAIVHAELLLFDSAMGCMIVELKYGGVAGDPDLLPMVILEANHHMANAAINAPRALRHKVVQGEEKESGVAFSLNALCTDLVGGFAVGRSEAPSWQPRLFVYTCIEVEHEGEFSKNELRYAHFAGRRFTTQYQLVTGKALYQPFKNIVHAAFIEGGVLIVNTYDADMFLCEYVEKNVDRTYLPIIILALHERYLIDHITSESAGLEFKSNPEEIDRLHHLRRELIRFRLSGRFTSISHLSLHNEVHTRIRAAFASDRILGETESNIAAAEAVLRFDELHEARAREKRRDTKQRRIEVIGIFIAMFITLRELAQVATKVRWDHHVAGAFARFLAAATVPERRAALTVFLDELDGRHKWELNSLKLALAVAVISLCGWMLWGGRRSHG